MDIEVNKKPWLELSSDLELLIFIIKDFIISKKLDFDLQTQKIDCNHCILLIKGRDSHETLFKIRLLQILEAIKILVVDMLKEKSTSFYISLNGFLLPKVRNAYKINERRETAQFFQRGRYENLINLIEYRIIRFMKPIVEEKLNLLDFPMPYLVMITRYLGKGDLLNFLMVNTKAHNNLDKDYQFWMRLYHMKFKRTGFKSNMLNWKSVYLSKLSN